MKKTEKTHITIQLPSALKKRADKKAQEMGYSLSHFVRYALQNAVKSGGEQNL